VERRGGAGKISLKPDGKVGAGAERRHVYEAFFWSARMLVARNGYVVYHIRVTHVECHVHNVSWYVGYHLRVTFVSRASHL